MNIKRRLSSVLHKNIKVGIYFFNAFSYMFKVACYVFLFFLITIYK